MRYTRCVNCRNATIVLFILCLCAGAQDAAPSRRAYQAAQQALAQGHYTEAERAYQTLARLDPNTAEVHANLGLIYFEERKFDPAVRELRRALELNPTLIKTAMLLSMSLSELGHYADALPGLEKGFRQSSDPETKRMCGLQLERAYTGLRQDDKAVEVALQLNRLYPSDPEILYHNGKIFGNFAFLSIQKLSQVATDSVWVHQAEAEAYESQGLFDMAINEYREVLRRDARRPGIHYRLGRTLLARSHQNASIEDVSAAGKEFEQELELDPTHANSAYELGEMNRNAGDFENAQKYFEMALNAYPDFGQAHLGLAAVLASRHKPELALPHLQRAISLDPANDVSWYRLSQIEGMLGNSAERQKAQAEFERLRSQKNGQTLSNLKLFSADEVTPQQLDQGVVQ